MKTMLIEFRELSQLISYAKYGIWVQAHREAGNDIGKALDLEHDNMTWNLASDIEEFIYLCPDRFFSLSKSETSEPLFKDEDLPF